jgi:hypothetical protein
LDSPCMVRSSSWQFLMLRSLLLAQVGGESNTVKITISENDGYRRRVRRFWPQRYA